MRGFRGIESSADDWRHIRLIASMIAQEDTQAHLLRLIERSTLQPAPIAGFPSERCAEACLTLSPVPPSLGQTDQSAVLLTMPAAKDVVMTNR